MNENVRIAKELVRLAKMIAATGEEKENSSFTQTAKNMRDNIVKNWQEFLPWLRKNKTMKVKDYTNLNSTIAQMFESIMDEFENAKEKSNNQQND